MFCTGYKLRVAKKVHKCTWCGEEIMPQSSYRMWKSVDLHWITSKMHPECHEALIEIAEDWNFTHRLYEGERPK